MTRVQTDIVLRSVAKTVGLFFRQVHTNWLAVLVGLLCTWSCPILHKLHAMEIVQQYLGTRTRFIAAHAADRRIQSGPIAGLDFCWAS